MHPGDVTVATGHWEEINQGTEGAGSQGWDSNTKLLGEQWAGRLVAVLLGVLATGNGVIRSLPTSCHKTLLDEPNALESQGRLV